MHPVVIQLGKQLEASVPVAHFCCQFFHLNFVLVFTENNVLSENTLNNQLRYCYFENLRILLGCNRSVLIMISEFSCKKKINKIIKKICK